MEIGPVFIAFIIYSIFGYIVFQGISLLTLAYIQKHEAPPSRNKLGTLISALVIAAIATGPLTWGNLIRRAIEYREEKEVV